MYREMISSGDLMVTYQPWWSLGAFKPYRNLSEEVRALKGLEEKAMSKYMELSYRYKIASTNVADELETLQLHLLDNSEAYFETAVDNSILEKKEGIRYNLKGVEDKKQGASPNKDQQKQQQNQKKQQDRRKGGGVSLLELLSKAKITTHQ